MSSQENPMPSHCINFAGHIDNRFLAIIRNSSSERIFFKSNDLIVVLSLPWRQFQLQTTNTGFFSKPLSKPKSKFFHVQIFFLIRLVQDALSNLHILYSRTSIIFPVFAMSTSIISTKTPRTFWYRDALNSTPYRPAYNCQTLILSSNGNSPYIRDHPLLSSPNLKYVQAETIFPATLLSDTYFYHEPEEMVIFINYYSAKLYWSI